MRLRSEKMRSENLRSGSLQSGNLRALSVRGLLALVCSGAVLSVLAVLLIFFLVTRDLRVLACGLILAALFFLWGLILLNLLQRKLSQFTDDLCRTLDDMMDGEERPVFDQEAETLLARISHRLERLYNIMGQNRRRVEAERSELQSLVSDLSHQTKTPVANLKMINDTLLTRPVPEEQRREFLKAAGSQLDKLDFLIQAMVKTSRLETGVIAMEKRQASVSDTLAGAVNGVLALMEKKQIALSVDCPEDLTVAHDSRWTGEALFNLLDNAVKYTPAGGSIQVAVREWEMYVKIDVTDTGRGIPEGAQAAIFKRFYREASVRDVDGIGIGLYLAREIITMQGGYIQVASDPGKGSTFSVFLPRR